MNWIVQIKGNDIPCFLEYKKTKILKMRFKDGSIFVVSPYFCSKNEILKFIYDHEKFLIKSIQQYQLIINKNQIHEYDILSILGKKYQIVYSETKNQIIDQTIFIKKSNQGIERKIIKKLFSSIQYDYFMELTKKYYALMTIKKDFPLIQIKDVKSKWGSYQLNKNIISFSSELIFKPIEVYDYIVVHELAHMIQFNHSKQFYEIVSQILPQYKILKKMLKDVNV